MDSVLFILVVILGAVLIYKAAHLFDWALWR